MQNMSSPTSESRDHASAAPSPATLSPSYSSLASFTARFPSSSVNSFCGAVAGAASGVVTCPLDVIKTKLQAQGSFRKRQNLQNVQSSVVYRGLFGTATTIFKQDGIRGMYRGLGPMLLGYLPTWAVYMSVYDGSKEYWYDKVENKWVARVLASVSAGACSTLVTNPIWVIKTRLMSQVSKSAAKDNRTPWYYKNTLDAAQKMWADEGIRAFYSGLTPALLGLSHVAIQFPLYEYFKMKFTGVEMGEVAGKDASGHTAGILAATFLSKVCATTATYPHEVLRTRLQTQQRQWQRQPSSSSGSSGNSGSNQPASNTTSGPRYNGILRTCQVILKEEGWRAFYNGMGTNMLRAVPAAMTTMVTFETLKSAVVRLQDQGRSINEEAS